MAQYKVPQDVEADDKLLGPFSFRQFVYLMIAGGLIAMAVGLFQLFPVLAIIPLPFAFLFGVLALPLRKDQPMETYLVAIVSYYLKPKSQVWRAGQRESTIQITAPKIVEQERARNITGEEATHRLSFLANIVDTGGQAIKGDGYNRMNPELTREAMNTYDMFEQMGLDNTIQQREDLRHNQMVEGMKRQLQQNIQQNNGMMAGQPMMGQQVAANMGTFGVPNYNNMMAAQPVMPQVQPMQASSPQEAERMRIIQAERMRRMEEARRAEEARKAEEIRKAETLAKNPSIIELANNNDYSVATIEKEAKRIKQKMEGEVFISLH